MFKKELNNDTVCMCSVQSNTLLNHNSTLYTYNIKGYKLFKMIKKKTVIMVKQSNELLETILTSVKFACSVEHAFIVEFLCC